MRLEAATDKYIRHMRGAGFDYASQTVRLSAFCKHLGDVELSSVDRGDVLSFLNKRPNSIVTFRAKWALIRNFLEYWHFRGVMPVVSMPPRPPRVRQEFSPYIFSCDEVRRLLEAALRLRLNHNWNSDSETIRAVFLFLYATGASLRDVLQLNQEDVNFEAATISFVSAENAYRRTIPIGSVLLAELRTYSMTRSRQVSSRHFFARLDGKPLTRDTICYDFEKSLMLAGLNRRDGFSYRPRLSDLRATFAVHRITSWIRRGDNLGRLLPALSAYLGQKHLSGTERFLMLTPERFTKELRRLRPGQVEWSCKPELLEYLDSL